MVVDPQPAMLEGLKHLLVEQSGIPVELLLVLLGSGLHVVTNMACRRSVYAPPGLFACLAAGICLECRDIWAHYKSIGLFAPQNDPLGEILLRHAVDIAWLSALPAAIVAGALIFRKPGGRSQP